jgi:hypothetical protein
MMTDTEIKQMIIAHLTAALQPEPAPFVAALTGRLFEYRGVAVKLPTGERSVDELVAEVTCQVSAQIVAQIEPRVVLTASYAMELFCGLVIEAKQLCPALDVEGFLQRAAIEAIADSEDGSAAV